MSVSYAGHVPLSPLSRFLLSGGAALAAISNPRRGDMVAAMGETTALGPVLENLRRRMESDVSGQRLLRDQPRVNEATIGRPRLAQLPDGTLGREYLRFLEGLSTSPDARAPVKYIDNPDHLYVMRRYRETHDFTHVVLEMKTNMLGEVTVKYFEGIQFGLPMCVTGGIFGAARLGPVHRELFLSQYLPWVVEQATKARFFLAMDWENRFEQPLRELQKELDVDPFPYKQ